MKNIKCLNPTMKKYTLIYSEFWNVGNRQCSNVKMKRFKTKNLSEWIKSNQSIFDGAQFLFHGWSKMEGEKV